jgi:hypothetical protein
MMGINSAVRDWAAKHPDGTAEQAVAELELPYPQDMVIIARGAMARLRLSRERPGEMP